MIELTRDDLAAIRNALGERYPIDERDRAIYRAGIAAGIERGQKFLDDLMLEQGRAGEYGSTAECARLFRALLK